MLERFRVTLRLKNNDLRKRLKFMPLFRWVLLGLLMTTLKCHGFPSSDGNFDVVSILQLLLGGLLLVSVATQKILLNITSAASCSSCSSSSSSTFL
jgi:hypothetical protein